MSHHTEGQKKAMRDLGAKVPPQLTLARDAVGRPNTFADGYLQGVQSVIKFKPLTEV